MPEPKFKDWEQKTHITRRSTISYIECLSDAQSGVFRFDIDPPFIAESGKIAFGVKDGKAYCKQLTRE